MASSSPAELSLDCKPQSYSMLLKSFGDHQSDQCNKLEEFLSRLEEERLKIDAFKRELPLCMQLLTNAVEASKQQLHTIRTNHQVTRPIMEDFIPIKQSNSEENTDKASNMFDNKANWMTSAQLWSQTSEGITKPQSTITPTKESYDIGFMSMNPKLALHNKHRNGGAFIPFSKELNPCPLGSSALRDVPELALVSTAEKDLEEKNCEEVETCYKRENLEKGGNDGGVIDQGKGAEVACEGQTTNVATNRKARRCWSPDLHRRFVNALQMLGGSQVATPKQIRELMKVDGLTNDEVKSHLQKYRLHTRRPGPSLQTGAPAPQLVVLGGIWVPPEYASAAAASAHTGAPTVYGPHPTLHAPPPHYCAATQLPQEFYTVAQTQPPLPPQPHHHAFHHLQMYNTAQHSRNSPEPEVAGGGDRSESIEDGKSESGSWKGESGEKEGERKGEESTGSEINLKF
ncbi:hypothetical protein TanjilG_28945 [Lupinus angustifolius]|uniref:HTH myb-type domain-containing protein n=1 Tax=Lupinus angustifolius TaxID=3871 RepID=A0A4P1QY11_LUPAN|nr:PREDICTED: myb family transcription factor EFM [Lupinus angustifolius]OIV97194.1 hypothetical protein TanjilG_28945 [Lupinus angustifolius]